MSKNVLIIDDETLVTRTLRILLKKNGYDVAIAASGIEALEIVKSQDFDLIISDIRMPEIDGIATIRRIRDYFDKENKKPIREILITGYADLDKYENAMDLEITDYLYKPFDNDDFLEVVKRNIG